MQEYNKTEKISFICTLSMFAWNQCYLRIVNNIPVLK